VFQLSEQPNPALNAIVSLLDAVVGAELQVTLTPPFPLQMLGVTFPSGYVTYRGSLTTPPCSEVVTWIVSSRPLVLSAGQVRRRNCRCSSSSQVSAGMICIPSFVNSLPRQYARAAVLMLLMGMTCDVPFR
jgi:carbonic anhydrase